MANASSSQSSAIREYVVRVPKTTRKRYHMMRFNADLGSDFFKTWTQCRMERENNLREYRLEQEIPKFGAGSEFGREQREEARRKRFGINVRKYRSEDQPWMLNIGGKNGKKYKGIREGGVADNTSWYVFMQGKDGSFEAYPVDEWYNFQPIQRYKALSAEEAEEEFVRRDKIMNFFQVMYEKKFKKGTEPDEEDTKKKGSKKSLMLSEMDEWFSEDDDGDDDDDEKDGDEDEDGSEKKKKKKKGAAKKKSQGGKKKKLEGGESDDSCEEESDDMNEGAEHDYISSDSSDSDQENEEVAGKEMAGVAEGDALRKLLESDEDEEEEENKDKEKQEEEKKEEDKEEKDKKKKKKKKKDKKSDKDSGEDSSDYSSDDHKKKKHEGSKNSEKKNVVNELKRKVKENPMEMPPQKKVKTDNAHSSSSSSGNSAASSNSDLEEAIKRYLTRKPMTTTELLRIFKKKKEMLSSEQLVTTIAQILKRVNPVKRMIKGKMYLSLKAT